MVSEEEKNQFCRLCVREVPIANWNNDYYCCLECAKKLPKSEKMLWDCGCIDCDGYYYVDKAIQQAKQDYFSLLKKEKPILKRKVLDYLRLEEDMESPFYIAVLDSIDKTFDEILKFLGGEE